MSAGEERSAATERDLERELELTRQLVVYERALCEIIEHGPSRNGWWHRGRALLALDEQEAEIRV